MARFRNSIHILLAVSLALLSGCRSEDSIKPTSKSVAQQGQASQAAAQQGTAKPQQGQSMPGGKPAAADSAKRPDTSARPAQTDRPGSGSGSGSGASPSHGSNRSSDDIDV